MILLWYDRFRWPLADAALHRLGHLVFAVPHASFVELRRGDIASALDRTPCVVAIVTSCHRPDVNLLSWTGIGSGLWAARGQTSRGANDNDSGGRAEDVQCPQEGFAQSHAADGPSLRSAQEEFLQIGAQCLRMLLLEQQNFSRHCSVIFRGCEPKMFHRAHRLSSGAPQIARAPLFEDPSHFARCSHRGPVHRRA
jgi:hypothetical protein